MKRLNINTYSLTIYFISIIFSLVIFLSNQLSASYKVMSILPLAWGVSVFMVLNSKELIYKVSTKIILILSFFRYAVGPLIVSIVGFDNVIHYSFTSEVISESIFIMVFELTSVFIVMLLFSRVENHFKKNQVSGSSDTLTTINLKSNIVLKLMYLFSILLILWHPDLLMNFQFLSLSESTTLSKSYFYGLDIRLLVVTKFFLFYELTLKLSQHYYKYKKNRFYYIALILSMIYIGIFYTDNRLNILVDILMASLLINKTFPTKTKKTIKFFLFVGSSVLIMASLYRMFAPMTWRPEGKEVEFSFMVLARMINSYFSGTHNVALSVETAKYFNNLTSIELFINDLFAWTGYLGSMLNIDPNNVSSYLFNTTFYSTTSDWGGYGDKIIPLVGQSRLYFGILGSPILSTLVVLWLLNIEMKLKKTKDSLEWFVHLFLCIRLAFFWGLNITILMMFFFDKYLQIWLILKLNRLLKIIMYKKRYSQ